MQEWTRLLQLTKGEAFTITGVRLAKDSVMVTGEFELPPLATLPAEDQLFISAFVRVHGSIKRMEELYGLSYPTIKNRLNRIGEALGKVQDGPIVEESPPGRTRQEERTADVDRLALLDQLAKGAISVKDVISNLKGTAS